MGTFAGTLEDGAQPPAVGSVDKSPVSPAATDRHRNSRREHGAGGTNLGGHATGAIAAAGATGHGNDVGINALDSLDKRRRRSVSGFAV